jgi:hypothetical protein
VLNDGVIDKSKQRILGVNQARAAEDASGRLPAAKSTGRPRTWPMREIINGIFYVMRSGCPWRLLPSNLPP